MSLLTPCPGVTNLATVGSLILQLAPSNILLADMNIDIARVVLLTASPGRHKTRKRTAAHIFWALLRTTVLYDTSFGSQRYLSSAPA